MAEPPVRDGSMPVSVVTDPGNQRRLIAALAAKLDRDDGPVRVFETHISCVLVGAAFAYKFKKAVTLGFLDFSTLEKRRFYCYEELRLNRRLAPEVYLGVAAIGGSHDDPVIGGGTPVIEYAVKMRAFGQDALWSERIGQHRITASEIDSLAQTLADFHRDAEQAPAASPWGGPDALDRISTENFSELAPLATDTGTREGIVELQAFLDAQARELRSAFLERKRAGKVRECHGDLHCANVITVDGRVMAFDCIEFNDDMRWIDVMNDLAFLCMDLECRRRGALAARLLNAYLERCGDYGGLHVFRYYATLRAAIRAKVSLLRAAQLDRGSEQASCYQAEGKNYLNFAMNYMRRVRPAIMITHGLSGSGKSTFSGLVVEILCAVRIRSDVERKRLHGLAATDRSGAASETLYGASSTQRTYAHLLSLAEQIAKAGWPVIIDAAFLERELRDRFRLLATGLGVPFFLFDIHASEDALRRRVVTRSGRNHDASDAGLQVLLHQLACAEPLGADEEMDCIRIDTNHGIGPDEARRRCEPILAGVRIGFS